MAENQEQQNTYNPLARVTTRGFQNIIAGGNKEAPIISWDAFGKPNINYDSAGKAKPATLMTTPEGAIGTQEDYVNKYQNIEKYQDDIRKIYAAIEPEFSKGRNIGSVPVTVWDSATDALAQAGKGFGRVFINSAHSVIAQKHNFAEARWKSFINQYDDNSQDKKNAEYAIYKAYEDIGEEGYLLKLDNMVGADGKPLSEEARKIVSRYRDLSRERKENEWRMAVEQIYEGERSEFLDNMKIANNEGDRSTMYGFLANMGGDIAGSLAAYWVTGRLAGGATATIGQLAGRLGMKFAPAVMASASVVGTRAVMAPSFLNQYNSIRTQALLKGADLDTANAAGFYAGVAEAGLEFAGFKAFNRLYAKDGWIRNYILANVIPESLQETSQTLAENVITKYFGLNDNDFTEIMKEIGLSAIAGGIGGGIFSSMRMNAEAIALNFDAVLNAYNQKTKGFSQEAVRAGTQEAIDRQISSVTEDLTPMSERVTVEEVVPEERTHSIERLGEPRELVEIREKTPAPAIQTAAETAAANQGKSTMEGSYQMEKEASRIAAQEALEEMMRLYEKRVKAKNPNITEQQLKNGFKAVVLQYNAQNTTGIIEQKFYNLVDNMITFIDKSNKAVIENNKKIQEILTKQGFSKEIAANLTSEDWSIKHAAQWQLAEIAIADSFEAAGLPRTEGQAAASFLKGLLFDTTFLNPDIKVSDVISALDLNMLNIQIATMHGMGHLLPEPFSSVLENTTRYRNISLEEKKTIADSIVSLLEDPIGNSAEISKRMYGSSDIDQNGSMTASSLSFVASAEQTILSLMPISETYPLSNNDFLAMAIMRRKGATQAEINAAFGLKQNIEGDVEAMYAKALSERYPAPTEEDLNKLNDLFSELEDEDNTILMSSKAKGFYAPYQNMLVVKDPLSGAALHEFGHFSITRVLYDAIRLDGFGLLPRNHGIKRILDTYIGLMKQEGRELSETELQETIVDSLQTYIATGAALTPRLETLFSEFVASHKTNMDKIHASLFNKRKDRGGLSKQQKADVITETAKIVNNLTPSSTITDSYDLEGFALLQQKEGVQEILGIEQSLQIIKDFISFHPLKDGDKFQAAAELAAASGDLITLRGIAFDVAQAAKAQSFDALMDVVSEKTPSQELPLTKQAISTAEGKPSEEYIFFMTDENERKAAARFRLPTTIRQDLKNVDWKQLYKAPFEVLKLFTESLETAASRVSPELVHILRREFYEFSEKSLAAKDEIAALTTKIDSHNKKHRGSGKEVNVIQMLLPLSNSASDSYSYARKYLVERLGEEACKDWDKIVKRLDEVKKALIKAGVDPKAFGVENYFPLKVKDYKGLSTEYFGKSNVNSEVAKIINRAYKEIKEGLDGKELTPEQEEKLKIDIVNEINGVLKGKSDDFKVTSFLHRKILNHDALMLQYYEDMFDTLSDYFDSAYRTIMMRNLVGPVTYDAAGNPIVTEGTGKVGFFLLEYQTSPAGKAHMEAIENFKTKMSYLAERHKDDKEFFKAIRGINQLTTLGSPINAVNQIQDLGVAAASFGPMNVFDGITKAINGSGIKIRDINAQSTVEALRPQGEGVISKATKTVFKYTGFEKVDVTVKNTIINAASEWFKKSLNSDPESVDYKRAMYYLDNTFPPAKYMMFSSQTAEQREGAVQERNDTRSRVLAELKAGINPESMSDDVKFLMWAMLSKTQPINALTVPAFYNQLGSIGKLCYQFGTVAVRQIEFLRDFYLSLDAAGGRKEAVRGLAELMLFCAFVGLTRDVITNLMRGRKTDVLESMLWTPAQFFMVNEYIASIAAKEGLFSAAVEVASPSFGIVDNITKDVYRAANFKEYKGHTFKSVPVFGQFAYWWFFGGRDFNVKTEQALFDMTEVYKERENAEKELGAL